METNRQGKYVIEMRKKYEEEIYKLHSQIGELLVKGVNLSRLLDYLTNDGIIEFWYTSINGVDYKYYKYKGKKYII